MFHVEHACGNVLRGCGKHSTQSLPQQPGRTSYCGAPLSPARKSYAKCHGVPMCNSFHSNILAASSSPSFWSLDHRREILDPGRRSQYELRTMISPIWGRSQHRSRGLPRSYPPPDGTEADTRHPNQYPLPFPLNQPRRPVDPTPRSAPAVRGRATSYSLGAWTRGAGASISGQPTLSSTPSFGI